MSDKIIKELKNEIKAQEQQLKCWAMMLEQHGINSDKMSAALSFSFNDGDSTYTYLESMLSLDEDDLKWFKDTHGMTLQDACPQ